MGDEGSGWFLGIEGVRAAVRAADRRGPATSLLPAVLKHFGLRDIRQIVTVVYRVDFERSEVSALAPTVSDAARSGDRVAGEIVERGVNGLAQIALGIARQLHEPNDRIAVYPTGGVFGATDMVLEPFTRAVGEEWPSATIHRARFSPALGALFRAAIDHGIAVDDTFLGRIETTLPGAASTPT